MLKGEKYMINARNVLVHEIIGLKASVSKSTDAKKEGIRGKVIDESRNLLVLETKAGMRKIPKKEATFLFEIGKDKAEVEGNSLIGRPENRIKLNWRKCYA